ncbi:MAG: ATP phosphoribosyltransferase regulatory subunit [Eubacterium sp.]
MKNFKVKINDRRLLRSFLQNCGFTEDQLDSVCITFDKMDKVGLDGVKAELTDKGFDATAIEKFIGFFGSVSSAQEISLESVEAILDDKAPAESVRGIINTVNELSDGQFDVVFDLSLVRGQGYYTGTVFEVESIDFKGAIAGGGRYDNLIGKFLGQQVSAVGFSIGFERIFSILMQNGVETKASADKIAVMYDDGQVKEAYAIAEKYRAEVRYAHYM